MPLSVHFLHRKEVISQTVYLTDKKSSKIKSLGNSLTTDYNPFETLSDFCLSFANAADKI